MILAATVLDWPVVARLGWVLIHSLWQGLLVAAVLAAVLAWLRERSAASRYRAAAAALAVLAALPVITFLTLDDATASPAGASPRSGLLQQLSGGVADRLGRSGYREDRETILPSPGLLVRELLEPFLPWLVFGWAIGVGILSVRLLGGWKEVRRLRHVGTRPVADPWPGRVAELARRAGIRYAIGLVESALVEVPTVIGWLRPAILLPASALAGLTPDQLEAILAHELAHIRRSDYLMNLLQVVIETVLFYHPVVWWVSGRLRQERENCCDDLAVAACGNRLGYARALTRLEELRHEVPPAAAALGMAADGGELIQRIRRLVGLPARQPGRCQAGAILLAALAVGGTAVAMSLPESGPGLRKVGKGGVDRGGGLKITLTLDRRVIRPGQPVPVTITYTNTTKQPLILTGSEQESADGLPGETYFVDRDESQDTFAVRDAGRPMRRIEIAPLQSWERTIPDLAVFLSSGSVNSGATPGRNPFDRPGVYKLRLQFVPVGTDDPGFHEPVRSNEVELTVKPGAE